MLVQLLSLLSGVAQLPNCANVAPGTACHQPGPLRHLLATQNAPSHRLLLSEEEPMSLTLGLTAASDRLKQSCGSETRQAALTSEIWTELSAPVIARTPSPSP